VLVGARRKDLELMSMRKRWLVIIGAGLLGDVLGFTRGARSVATMTVAVLLYAVIAAAYFRCMVADVRSPGDQGLVSAPSAALIGPACATVSTLAVAASFAIAGEQPFRAAAQAGVWLNVMMMLPILGLYGDQATATTKAWRPGLLVLWATVAVLPGTSPALLVAGPVCVIASRTSSAHARGAHPEPMDAVTSSEGILYLGTASGLLIAAALVRLGG
jgi:hypothetical protein